MRAAVLETPGPAEYGPLTVREIAGPTPGPDELLLDVEACAVCRTDLQIAEGDIPLRRQPVIPGHQAVGRVAALGEGVQGWREGDRVGVAWFAGACGTCRFCRDGLENLCEDARFTGWDRDGGFAERMTVRADYAIPVPQSLAATDAAPLLCGGIIGYRSLRRSGIRPGGRLGLFGFGASARLAIQVAVQWGCEVYVVSRGEHDLEAARKLGAAWTGFSGETPPQPLDAAITFAPAGSVVVEALQALERGGTVAINAIHLDGIPAFKYEPLWLERTITSVANFTRQDAREFMALAAAIPIHTETETHPLQDANEALARIKRGEAHGAAVLAISP